MKKFLHIFSIFFVVSLVACILFAMPTYADDDGELITVVLDPGHGGPVSTGTCFGKHYETYYNLKVANYCRQALMEHGGFEVFLTHETEDDELELMERVFIANEHNADLVFSIHFDGLNNASAECGAHALVSVIPEYDAADLAEMVISNIESYTGIGRYRDGIDYRYDSGDVIYYWDASRGWSVPGNPQVGQIRDYYGILKWSCYLGMKSLIVEHGFMSNDYDRELVEQEETLKKLGQADADAIIEYFCGHTHDYSVTKTDYQSNCMLQGKSSTHCSICGARKDVVMLEENKDNHLYVLTSRANVSCTSDGYEEWTCMYTDEMNVGKEGYCEQHRFRNIFPALGHDWVLISETPAGHGFDGLRTYKCNNCNNYYYEVIYGEPHDFDENGVCTVCSYALPVETQPPETIPPETIPPETAPPETVPETQPETIIETQPETVPETQLTEIVSEETRQAESAENDRSTPEETGETMVGNGIQGGLKPEIAAGSVISEGNAVLLSVIAGAFAVSVSLAVIYSKKHTPENEQDE